MNITWILQKTKVRLLFKFYNHPVLQILPGVFNDVITQSASVDDGIEIWTTRGTYSWDTTS